MDLAFIKEQISFFDIENKFSLKKFLGSAMHAVWPQTSFQRAFAVFLLLSNIIVFTCFIFYAVAFKFNDLNSPFHKDIFKLGDNGLCETIGYFLEGYIAVLFGKIAYHHKKPHWYAFSAIFVIILIDDSLHYHEMISGWLGTSYELDDTIGDVIGFACLGLPIMSLWVGGAYSCPSEYTETMGYIIFTGFLCSLIFFGVFVDVLHTLADRYTSIPTTIMSLAEDGMEFVTICLCAMGALRYYTYQSKSP